jgi:hypothetical protein
MEEVQRSAEEMEMKYVDTAGQLDMVRADLEEALRKNEALEKKLQASLLNQVHRNASPTVEPQTCHFAKEKHYTGSLFNLTTIHCQFLLAHLSY